MAPPEHGAHHYEGGDLEALLDLPNYYEWIRSRFAAHVGGEVVEYGAGLGTMSAHLAPLAQRLQLVEPSAQLAASLRGRFASEARVLVIERSLEAHVRELAPQSVDAFVLVNVLEHVEADGWALQQMARACRPGGTVCLYVPALRVLYSDLDRALGHVRRYHAPELYALARAAGFDVVDGGYTDAVGAVAWGLVHTLGRRTRIAPGAARQFDRWAVPAQRWLESRWRPPRGKNVWLVATRAR